jgi:acetyl esterase/lipase
MPRPDPSPPLRARWGPILGLLAVACGDPSKGTKTLAEDSASGGCPGAGCLVEALPIARLSRPQLQAAAGPVAAVDNGYEVYQITYRTSDGVATGTVTLPLDDGAPPPAGGWPLVVNAHGTIGLDDPCRLSGTLSGAALAGLFGARGTIGVAPDYLGIGGPGLHPYLDAVTEAEAALDAARAAAALARGAGLPVSDRLAVVGLSQGGHAALATAARAAAHAPELELRAVGAAAPASGFIEHWRRGVDLAGPHLAYHALLSHALATAAGVPAQAVFAEGFAEEADAVLRGTCLWSPTFTDEPTLLDRLPLTPEALFHPDHRAAFAGRAPPRPWLELGAARARLGPLDTPARVIVWQGTEDIDVLPSHTAELVDALRADGQPVELRWVEGAGHLGVAFGFLGVPEVAGEEAAAEILAALRAG